MFLGGDPSYVQKDAQLIKQLGLDLKFVSVGAEPAQVARWTQAYKQKKPILFYWYTPQYLNKAYQLSEIKLPPRSKNCVDSYNPKLGSNWSIYRCAYGQTIIDKLITSKFAKSGSPAVRRDQALEVDGRRPELRREPDRRQAHGPGEGGGEVGQGEPRQGQGLARQVDARAEPRWRERAGWQPRRSRCGAVPRGLARALMIYTAVYQRAIIRTVLRPDPPTTRRSRERAYHAIRELIVTLELAPGLAGQRARADGAARPRAHAGARGAAHARAGEARRGLSRGAGSSSRRSTSATSPRSPRRGSRSRASRPGSPPSARTTSDRDGRARAPRRARRASPTRATSAR